MYLSFAIVWNLHTGWHEENLLWMTVGIMAALWGADLPDYDQQTKYLSHRDIRTHSALIALVFFLITYFLSPITVLDYIAPSLALFFIGNASHLFLDEWPVWAGSGDPKKGEGMKKGGTLTAARWFVEGVTGDALYKALEGTYLIHLPFRIPVEERKKMQSGKTEMKIEERKCSQQGANPPLALLQRRD